MRKIIFTNLICLLLLTSCKQNKRTGNSQDDLKLNESKETKKKSNNNKKKILKKRDNLELFPIEGTYTFEDDIANCFLRLNIYKKGGLYKYKLKTPTRKLNGDISLKIGEEKDGYYITIKNIEWSENLGALNEEGEPIDKDIKLPKGLEGYLYKDGIVIQNYGNSMNYYIQLGECNGSKYIELKKQ